MSHTNIVLFMTLFVVITFGISYLLPMITFNVRRRRSSVPSLCRVTIPSIDSKKRIAIGLLGLIENVSWSELNCCLNQGKNAYLAVDFVMLLKL